MADISNWPNFKLKKVHNDLLTLALWSRGRVDGSQSEGPGFDPHVSQKVFPKSLMDVVG